MLRQFVTTTINGSLRLWTINRIDNTSIIKYFYHNSPNIEENIVRENQTAYLKRIKDKLKTGYVEIDTDLPKLKILELIKDNQTNIPFKEPMKCQKYDPVKFTYPCMGQPKLNGVRCYIAWGIWEQGEGMFKTEVEGVILLSNGGNRYEVPHISSMFTKEDFYNERTKEHDLYYDGELYVHGENLNTIKSRIPIEINGVVSTSKLSSDPVKFYCFDIAMEDTEYVERRVVRFNSPMLTDSYVVIGSLENGKGWATTHALRKSNFVYVHDQIIHDAEQAQLFTDRCIEAGFEGAVLRTFDNIYLYGKKPKDIIKIKRYKDSEFEVLDIIAKPQGGCLFVCRNDINQESFESNPMGSYPQQEEWLRDKDKLIGSKVTIKYYERSGVKKVPFHSNIITVRDYE